MLAYPLLPLTIGTYGRFKEGWVECALIGVLELSADGHARRWCLDLGGLRLVRVWRRFDSGSLERTEEELGGLLGDVDTDEEEK
jgi:hypothetical protein